MRHHILLLSLFSVAALPGCGRPEIKIDATAVATRAGNLPVGLFEVHRARSGDSPGISIGEALDESLYCTGTLLSDGRVLTSADCLADASRRFDVSDMEFHLNESGSNVTRHFGVVSADADKARPGLAYLRVNFTPDAEEKASALSLQRGGLRISDANRDLEAQTISIGEPQANGIALGAANETTVLYNPNGFAFPVDPPAADRTRRNRRNQNNGYNNGYPNNGYPNNGYNNGYPRNGYPNNGYNNGYPNNGYNNGNPNNGYPGNYPGNVPGYGTGPNLPTQPGTGPGPGPGVFLFAPANPITTGTSIFTGTDTNTDTGLGTATFTNTSTATDTDTEPFPGAPIPYYPPRSGTDTSTDTDTNTNPSGDVAYAPLKAVGAEGASLGSPIIVDGQIVGVVKKGGSRNAPGTVYWLDDTANQAQGRGRREERRDESSDEERARNEGSTPRNGDPRPAARRRR